MDPLAILPPDLRRALRGLLRGYEPMLRQVSRAWRIWAKVAKTEASAKPWDYFLVKRGEAALLSLHRAKTPTPAVHISRILGWAAKFGREDIMRQAITPEGPNKVNTALAKAAKAGQTNAMALLRSWGASDFLWALIAAIKGGKVASLILLEEWGELASVLQRPDFSFRGAYVLAASRGHAPAVAWLAPRLVRSGARAYFTVAEAFRAAAAHGQTQTMLALKNHPVPIQPKLLLPLEVSLRDAAANGQIRAMSLLKEWGVRGYGSALKEAAISGELEAMAELKRWGATNFDEALHAASAFHRSEPLSARIQAMRLLKEWGATDFTGARERALSRGQEETAQLLLEWSQSSNPS